MKLYEIIKSVEATDELPARTKHHFEPRKGQAKKFARVWNEGKRLSKSEDAPVQVTEHVVTGGRSGLCDWLNDRFDPQPKKTKTVKVAKVKAAKKVKKAKTKKGKK